MKGNGADFSVNSTTLSRLGSRCCCCVMSFISLLLHVFIPRSVSLEFFSLVLSSQQKGSSTGSIEGFDQGQQQCPGQLWAWAHGGAGIAFVLALQVTLGDSTHNGLFLVMEPFSGPWVSLGQGNGCE